MNVGVIGLGIMGRALAERLLETGYTVRVYNRTPERSRGLIAAGAHEVESPREAAAESEVVFTLVTDSAAIREVTLGADGVQAGLRPNSVHCDMSTVAPHEAGEVAAIYRQSGKRFVQAPVLGSKRQIAQGELLVFAGGQDQDVFLCERAWSPAVRRVWKFPTHEQASAMKLACNMMITQMITTLSQSMVFVQKLGIEQATLLEILSDSALGAPMFQSKGKSILNRDFSANFTLSNAIKDMTLANMAGRHIGMPLIVNDLVRQHFIAAESAGHGEEDYSAVVKVLEKMAGISEPASG